MEATEDKIKKHDSTTLDESIRRTLIKMSEEAEMTHEQKMAVLNKILNDGLE